MQGEPEGRVYNLLNWAAQTFPDNTRAVLIRSVSQGFSQVDPSLTLRVGIERKVALSNNDCDVATPGLFPNQVASQPRLLRQHGCR